MLLVVAGLLRSGNRVLLTQRRDSGQFPGFWEFPGGKIEAGEDPRTAIRRELQEELAIEVSVGPVVDVLFHRYPDKNVLIIVYSCQWQTGRMQNLAVAAHRWVPIADLSDYRMLPADVPLIHRLQAEERP